MNTGGAQEDSTTGEEVDDMASPQDSGIEMKKKRLAAMKANMKKQGEVTLGVQEADLGASPQMAKGGFAAKFQH